jgi:predicted ABC-type ATPase
MPAQIFVLAGVNGAGKSSIGGEMLRKMGVANHNPDAHARRIRELAPNVGIDQANAQAWTFGRNALESAIRAGSNFAFETTLGGSSITETLIAGAKAGAQVHVWYVGLSTPELHIRRVKARVRQGGHDIPEDMIRARFDSSRANLIRLIPHLQFLRVFDNSAEAQLETGRQPAPLLLLQMTRSNGKAQAQVFNAGQMPQWAKPIVTAARRQMIRRIA